MAADYAAIIQAASAAGPVRLLGWSLGALVAHAVAAELEQAGREVQLVGMIDPPPPGRGLDADDTTLALAGIIYDVNPAPPPATVLFGELARLRSLVEPPPDLQAWCEQRGLLPSSALDAAVFDASVRLYRLHAALVADHTPRAIRAPLMVWWAEASRARYDWSALTSRIALEAVLPGTHYTIVRPPLLSTIVADLRR
jgi:thioesterase domain-containing protein